MNKGRNIFWGVLFILGALAMLIGKLGYLEGFGFWNILFSIGLVGFLVDGVLRKNIGTVLFSVAFLVILHDEFLGMEALTPWPVLGAALLGTIGCHILFPKKKWKMGIHKGNQEAFVKGTQEFVDGECVRFENSFSETVKYIRSTELSSVNVECSFGHMEVYFDGASLKNNIANVYVECSFGSIVLNVPSDWKVVINTNNSFGGVEEKGHCNPAGENTLQVMGDVSFGGLEIRYI